MTYVYDSATLTNGKGRLASVSSSVSSYAYGDYDAMGRPSGGTQTIGSQAYTVGYTYGLSGNVLTQTYPSGRTVTNTYDNAGRQTAVAGTLGDGTSRTYATAITYDAGSRMTKEQFGTTAAIYNKLFYNSRGQLSEIRDSSTSATDTSFNRGAIINFYSGCWGMCAGQSMADNNGNLQRQEVYIPDNEGNTTQHQLSEDFEYDSLNRLQRVKDGSAWQQEYVYDRYGNRSINGLSTKTWGAGINILQMAVVSSTTTNRMYAPGETEASHPTMTYDAAGNQTKDTYSAVAFSRAYDAENRMTSETQASSYVAGTYSYDGDGRRVKRNVNSIETWQVYGLGGELLAEYAQNAAAANPQKEYGYRNGQLLITADAPARTNYALSSNGATASASTTMNSSYPASNVNNGERAGGGSTTGGAFNGWIGSSATFTQWLQIDFGQTRSINEIDVLGIQDNFSSPSAPTLSMAWTLYGLSGYDVQYWNGSAWVGVSGGSITSNNKVWRQITFSAINTSKIRVLTNASPDNYSRLTEVEAWGDTTPAVNVALTSNGATASASTTINSSYPASNINNGERAGDNSTTGGAFNGWISSSATFTQWLQIDFGQTRSITEVDVFGIQDNFSSPSTPTLSMTFANYALQGFDVQYWNGSAWVTVTGGGITSNDKVWKKITFSAVSTTKIRVLTNASPDNYSRLTEVEAWTAASDSNTANVHWLVTDQLGTPRMIFDQSGSLAGTSRHDYLPFGEEIFAGTAGRTTALGYPLTYPSNDGSRQKFTDKERDVETGLDFSEARYYASMQGRFTSPDPLYLEMHRLSDPQQLNLYSYARNVPTKFNDPNGLDIYVAGDATEEYKKRLQQDTTKFKIGYNGRDIVVVDDKGKKLGKDALGALGNSLSGRDKELFNAITDPNHHVTIVALMNEGEDARSRTSFGGFAGNSQPGFQVIDFGDIRLLDTPENSAVYSPATAVGHETLEAYYGTLNGEDYGDAHRRANQSFQSVEEVQNSFQLGPADSKGRYSTFSGELVRPDNPNLRLRFTAQYLSPVPEKSLPQPAHITKVERVTPKGP